MQRIDLLYFDVTSGHRSAAQAIAKAIRMRDPHTQIRLLSLIDVLQYQPFLRAMARVGEDLFNWGVRREQAYLAHRQVGFFQAVQARIPRFLIRRVGQFWQGSPPDAVVSVLPICNLLLERALHTRHPTTPYMVIPVDFEEALRNYWFDPRMDAYYINPTEVLATQAAERGIMPERHLLIKGMPIDPIFYEPPALERAHELRQLGLNPELPTVLVGFGGQGSVFVRQSAEQLCALGAAINVIFLCGRHTVLYNHLCAMQTPYRKAVLQFTPEPPAYYYHLADVMIGKPGSMTITEALITRTVLLAVESQSLAVVQRGNEAWLRRSGVGEVIRLSELADAVRRLLQEGSTRPHLEREYHRGVFSMADVIMHVAQGGSFHLFSGEAA